MDQCWKRKMEEDGSWTSTRWTTVKEEPTEVEASLWTESVYGKAGSTEYENGEKTVGQ